MPWSWRTALEVVVVVRDVGLIFTGRKFLSNSTDDARTSGLRVGKTTNNFFRASRLALDDIHEFTKGQDYGVLSFRSKTDKQVPPTVRTLWLRCTKGRDYTKAPRMRLA